MIALVLSIDIACPSVWTTLGVVAALVFASAAGFAAGALAAEEAAQSRDRRVIVARRRVPYDQDVDELVEAVA